VRSHRYGGFYESCGFLTEVAVRRSPEVLYTTTVNEKDTYPA
jgi:hypothetical protein